MYSHGTYHVISYHFDFQDFSSGLDCQEPEGTEDESFLERSLAD